MSTKPYSCWVVDHDVTKDDKSMYIRDASTDKRISVYTDSMNLVEPIKIEKKTLERVYEDGFYQGKSGNAYLNPYDYDTEHDYVAKYAQGYVDGKIAKNEQ